MGENRSVVFVSRDGRLLGGHFNHKKADSMQISRHLLLWAMLLAATGCHSLCLGAAATDPRRPVKRPADRQPVDAAQVGSSKVQATTNARVQTSGEQTQGTEGHYQAARIAVARGDTAVAMREARLALQENPLDAEAHFLLGCLLQKQGESDQAVVGFHRAVAIDPVKHEAQYNLATMLLARGEAIRAASLLESAVLTRPDHVPAYNNLAKAYFLAGLPELSVATYEESLRRDAANAIALRNLQLLLEAAGNPDAAATYRRRLEALRQGGAVFPGDVVAPRALTPSPSVHQAALAGGQSFVVGESLMPPPAQRAADDTEADALRDILRDLPNVKVERRGGRLTLIGWTSGPREREILDKVLGKPSGAADKQAPAISGNPSDILDLTTDDSGDPQRMIEIDAVLFILRDLNQRNVGFNFLRAIDLNLRYFTSGTDNQSDLSGHSDLSGFSPRGAPVSTLSQPSANGSAAWSTTGPIEGLVANTLTRTISQISQEGWVFGAGIDYVVNIANAVDERLAILARPHLTALSGTPAKFLAGGELVFKVSGLNSGDIRPYPFGTTLTVTPTLLRTPAPDGTPRVHITVEAGRTSVLSILDQESGEDPTFEKLTVTSEAVLNIGQTLILSGLNQRESRSGRSGVPVLRDIPLVKYLFSSKSTIENDVAVLILLTPRDPAFWDEQYLRSTREFLEMRRAFLQARLGTDGDMQRFRERYPDWSKIPPSRFGSHFILLQNSEIYRSVSGQSLTGEDVDLELLGPKTRR